MTQLLTQIVLHPTLWHCIEPTSPGCTLSPHRHRDKPLMSLHLRLRPMRVGSESKNKRPGPDDSGPDRSVTRVDVLRTSLACVASESSGTWSRTELECDGSGVVIGIESALAMHATRTWRSEIKHI